MNVGAMSPRSSWRYSIPTAYCSVWKPPPALSINELRLAQIGRMSTSPYTEALMKCMLLRPDYIGLCRICVCFLGSQNFTLIYFRAIIFVLAFIYKNFAYTHHI